MRKYLLLVLLACGCGADLPTSSPVPPVAVNVNVVTSVSVGATEGCDDNDAVVTLALIPPTAIDLRVGDPISVKVVATDQHGVELPPTGLSYSIADPSIMRLDTQSGRVLTFRALAPGSTEVLISSNGQTASLPVVVARSR